MNAITDHSNAPGRQGCRALAMPRFELLPLKGMQDAARALPAGATVTVTCSPRHGLERTLEAAEWLVLAGFRPVPHLAARMIHDRRQLQRILDRLAASGIDDCFLIGGDQEDAVGDFAGGVELLETLADMSPRPGRIGIPAYPEGHHRLSTGQLREALAAKTALADYAVTQMCFESAPIREWLQTQRELGLAIPVYAGIPGVLDRARMMSVAMRIGLGPSTRALTRQRGLVGRLLRPSAYQADDLIWALAPLLEDPGSGLAGLHVYTFNAAADTYQWLQALHDQYCAWYGLGNDADAGVSGIHAEQPG